MVAQSLPSFTHSIFLKISRISLNKFVKIIAADEGYLIQNFIINIRSIIIQCFESLRVIEDLIEFGQYHFMLIKVSVRLLMIHEISVSEHEINRIRQGSNW